MKVSMPNLRKVAKGSFESIALRECSNNSYRMFGGRFTTRELC